MCYSHKWQILKTRNINKNNKNSKPTNPEEEGRQEEESM